MKKKLLAGIILNFMIPSVIIGLCWWWEIPLFMPIGFILVLLIHEAGHFLSMRCFGYESLKFYLLLPLGALVYGEKEHSRTSESAIIYLAGPLPGILIGTILSPLGARLDSDIITFLAIIFLFINTVNLLPIFPLDGGQLLVTIFRLNRKQILFVIKVSLAVTTAAMVIFWLFELIILIAIQVYCFIDLRADKDFINDHFYDLNKIKLVLVLLIYLLSLVMALTAIG